MIIIFVRGIMLDQKIKDAIEQSKNLQDVIAMFPTVDQSIIKHHVKTIKPEWLTDAHSVSSSDDHISSAEELSNTSVLQTVVQWTIRNPLATTQELYTAFPKNAENILRSYRKTGREQFTESFASAFMPKNQNQWSKDKGSSEDFRNFLGYVVTYPAVAKQSMCKKYSQYTGEFLVKWKKIILKHVYEYLAKYSQSHTVLDHASSLNLDDLKNPTQGDGQNNVNSSKDEVDPIQLDQSERLEKLENGYGLLLEQIENLGDQIERNQQIVLEAISKSHKNISENSSTNAVSSDNSMQEMLMKVLLQKNSSDVDTLSFLQKMTQTFGSVTLGKSN